MDSTLKLIPGRVSALACGLLAALIVPILPGCIRVKTEPIRVEPIYIEVTVNHRLQKALDDIFADIDQASQTTEYEPLEEENSNP